jgi:hypothetical protein
MVILLLSLVGLIWAVRPSKAPPQLWWSIRWTAILERQSPATRPGLRFLPGLSSNPLSKMDHNDSAGLPRDRLVAAVRRRNGPGCLLAQSCGWTKPLPGDYSPTTCCRLFASTRSTHRSTTSLSNCWPLQARKSRFGFPRSSPTSGGWPPQPISAISSAGVPERSPPDWSGRLIP